MYTEFFGLKEAPFDCAADARYFFASPQHEEAVATVLYAVQERKGLVLVTGDVGVGKSMIGHMLLREIGSKASIANLTNTHLREVGLLPALCREFQLAVDPGFSVMEMLASIEEYLLTEQARGRVAALVLDDAHDIDTKHFQQLRLVSNLEIAGGKLLQIVLLGQASLNTMMQRPALKQLQQRVFRNMHLFPLSRDLTSKYMEHRLRISGWSGEQLFEDQAQDLIHQFSNGIPRLINNLCDNVMLSAFTDETPMISRDRVSDVIDEITSTTQLTANSTLQVGSDEVDQAIAELTSQYVQSLEQQIDKLETARSDTDNRIHELHRLSAKLQAQDVKFSEHQTGIDKKIRELHRMTVALQEQEQAISRREKALAERMEEMQALSERLDKQEKTLVEREAKSNQQLRDLERMGNHIVELDQKLSDRADFIDKKLANRQVSFDREVNECKRLINRKWQEMKDLVAQFEARETERVKRLASVDQRLVRFEKIEARLEKQELKLRLSQEHGLRTVKELDSAISRLHEESSGIRQSVDRDVAQAKLDLERVSETFGKLTENADILLGKPEAVLQKASKQLEQVDRMSGIIKQATEHLEATVSRSLGESRQLIEEARTIKQTLKDVLERTRQQQDDALETIAELEATTGKTHKLRDVIREIFARSDAQIQDLADLISDAEVISARLPKQLEELEQNTLHPAKLMKELRSVGSIAERHLHDGQIRLSELRVMVDKAEKARRSIEAIIHATRRVADRRTETGNTSDNADMSATAPTPLGKKIDTLTEAVRRARQESSSTLQALTTTELSETHPSGTQP